MNPGWKGVTHPEFIIPKKTKDYMIYIIDNRRCNTKWCRKHTIKESVESDTINPNISYKKTTILCQQPKAPYTYFLLVTLQVLVNNTPTKEYTWAEPVESDKEIDDMMEYPEYKNPKKIYPPPKKIQTKEDRKEYFKNYYHTHQDYYKTYYQEHKEHIKEKNKIWYQNNKEKHKAYNKLNYLKKKNQKLWQEENQIKKNISNPSSIL